MVGVKNTYMHYMHYYYMHYMHLLCNDRLIARKKIPPLWLTRKHHMVLFKIYV